jgi:hypothetical protein
MKQSSDPECGNTIFYGKANFGTLYGVFNTKNYLNSSLQHTLISELLVTAWFPRIILATRTPSQVSTLPLQSI